jgi:hypothetical protein
VAVSLDRTIFVASTGPHWAPGTDADGVCSKCSARVRYVSSQCPPEAAIVCFSCTPVLSDEEIRRGVAVHKAACGIAFCPCHTHDDDVLVAVFRRQMDKRRIQ